MLSASESNSSVVRCGARFTPRSSAVMARVLTPARSANSSCVKPARRRWRRSRSAKFGATPAPVSLARPLPLMVMAVGSPSSSPRRPVGACSWSLILSYFATSHKTRPMRCIRGAATASMVARMASERLPGKCGKCQWGTTFCHQACQQLCHSFVECERIFGQTWVQKAG